MTNSVKSELKNNLDSDALADIMEKLQEVKKSLSNLKK